MKQSLFFREIMYFGRAGHLRSGFALRAPEHNALCRSAKILKASLERREFFAPADRKLKILVAIGLNNRLTCIVVLKIVFRFK